MTDSHLNFLRASAVRTFMAQVADSNADCILVGSDIGEADSFGLYLIELADTTNLPIWFVIGNHDFYGGSTTVAERRAQELTN